MNKEVQPEKYYKWVRASDELPNLKCLIREIGTNTIVNKDIVCIEDGNIYFTYGGIFSLEYYEWRKEVSQLPVGVKCAGFWVKASKGLSRPFEILPLRITTEVGSKFYALGFYKKDDSEMYHTCFEGAVYLPDEVEWLDESLPVEVSAPLKEDKFDGKGFKKFEDFWNSLKPQYKTPDIIFRHFEKYYNSSVSASLKNNPTIEEIKNKYKKYISNIEWDNRTNERKGRDKELNDEHIIYCEEFIEDLRTLQNPSAPLEVKDEDKITHFHVNDNSDAFRDWLKGVKINFIPNGHFTSIPIDKDIFTLGYQFALYKQKNNPAPLDKEQIK